MKPPANLSNRLYPVGVAVAVLVVFSLPAAFGCGVNTGGSADRATVPSATVEGAPGIVTEVVDGDTIMVSIAGRKESVRLIGIDTPEATGGFLPVECYGDRASALTGSLLPVGTSVRLTRDVEARDRYGRLLAYVHRADDGLFVNLEIATRGYAEALVIEPNTTHADDFYRAAAQARDRGLGLWGACGSADVEITGPPAPERVAGAVA
ncbi:thermonuclease family protein [Candidatus Poriferisocius sp.]|uniref:thermonuclease family protein n=1 Tax=Candidatus Poriferisocius sp. TaxID=3101276 RepID=UPI003B02961F